MLREYFRAGNYCYAIIFHVDTYIAANIEWIEHAMAVYPEVGIEPVRAKTNCYLWARQPGRTPDWLDPRALAFRGKSIGHQRWRALPQIDPAAGLVLPPPPT